MLDTIAVIRVSNQLVTDSSVFFGESKDVKAQAEAQFTKLFNSLAENGHHPYCQLDTALKNLCVTFDRGSIFMTRPTVNQITEPIEQETSCEYCKDKGVKLGKYNQDFEIVNHSNWAFAERCDDCQKYDSDFEAAKANYDNVSEVTFKGASVAVFVPINR